MDNVLVYTSCHLEYIIYYYIYIYIIYILFTRLMLFNNKKDKKNKTCKRAVDIWREVMMLSSYIIFYLLYLVLLFTRMYILNYS